MPQPCTLKNALSFSCPLWLSQPAGPIPFSIICVQFPSIQPRARTTNVLSSALEFTTGGDRLETEPLKPAQTKIALCVCFSQCLPF